MNETSVALGITGAVFAIAGAIAYIAANDFGEGRPQRRVGAALGILGGLSIIAAAWVGVIL